MEKKMAVFTKAQRVIELVVIIQTQSGNYAKLPIPVEVFAGKSSDGFNSTDGIQWTLQGGKFRGPSASWQLNEAQLRSLVGLAYTDSEGLTRGIAIGTKTEYGLDTKPTAVATFIGASSGELRTLRIRPHIDRTSKSPTFKLGLSVPAVGTASDDAIQAQDLWALAEAEAVEAEAEAVEASTKMTAPAVKSIK